jgi:hypothetical protein
MKAKQFICSGGALLFALNGVAHAQSVATPKVDTSVPAGPKVPRPNGFDLFVEAEKLIVAAKPAVDSVNDTEVVNDPKIRAEKYSLANKQAWLRKNAAGFALFQKALRTPTRHPNQRFEAAPTFPYYARLRQLARYKSIEVHAREMQGDWNGATQSRLDIVQMGNDTGRGGVLISGLVSIAIEAIGRDTPWPATEKLNLPQTRAALARLQNIYARRLLAADILQEEKYYGLTMLRAQMRDPKWRDITKWDEDATPADRLRALVVSPETVLQNYARTMDVHIANARLPLLAKKAPLPTPNDPFTKVLAPVFSHANLNFARNDAGNAVWLCALALRAYKLENGKYPANLDELAPHYLKEIPADPFGGGEKLRYRRTKDFYVLWSIGPDGKDDGGKPIGRRKGYKPTPGLPARLPSIDFEAKGDYVAGKNR